jgi:hypothetical protein
MCRGMEIIHPMLPFWYENVNAGNFCSSRVIRKEADYLTENLIFFVILFAT